MSTAATDRPRGSASGPSAAPPGWELLLTPEGEERLALVESALDSGESEFALGARLRAEGLDGDAVAALLGQAALRRRAEAKFGALARRLLFTPAGLEQASREPVAALHAQRFAGAGCRLVADLGCGIGTESLALRTAGIGVLAVEIDPFTARLAERNLRAALSDEAALGGAVGVVSGADRSGATPNNPSSPSSPSLPESLSQSGAPFLPGDPSLPDLPSSPVVPSLPGIPSSPAKQAAFGSPAARVLTADATTVSLDGVDGVFLDPARRTAGHRNTRRLASPDDHSPSLDFAFELGSRLPTGVKLGPGLDRALIPEHAEAQWVSVEGQLVEMGLWFGALARPGVRRAALVIRRGESHELTSPTDADDAAARDLGEYLYEPDGAVIRARLIGLLAEQLGAGMVSEGIAYLTADTFVPTPFAQAFRVVEELPAGEKQLRRALAERGIGRLEIKKRGADVDPAALRTRLRLKGSKSATLFLTRIAGRHAALLSERL